jgi:outer membrane protein assembly factor BamB
VRAAWLLVFVLACSSKRDAPGSGSGPAGAAKRASCEQAILHLEDVSIALSGALGQLLGGPQNKLVKCLRTEPQGSSCLALPEADAAIATCLQWPDDVVACIAEIERHRSRACIETIERWLGFVGTEPAAPGPDPRWKVELPFEPSHAIAARGMVALGADEGVLALAHGTLLWTAHERATAGLVEVAGERCVLAAGERDLACLALDSGRVTFRAALPRGNKDLLVTGAAARDSIVLATTTPAMYALSPPACKRKAAACLEASGAITEGADDVALLASGTRVLSSVSHVFLTDARGAPLATFRAGVVMGITVDPRDRVIVAADNKLVHIDASACTPGNAPVPLDGSPCTTTLATFEETPSPPVAAGDALIVTIGTQLRRVTGATWKVELGQMSAPVAAAGKLYVLTQEDLVSPVVLRAIDPDTGKTLWTTPVPGASELVAAKLVATDGELVAIFRTAAYGFPITAP